MSRRSSILIALILVGSLLAASDVRRVKSDYTWTETIYIRPDGSIYPSGAPISTVDNVTYSLTDNIAGNVPVYVSAIVVERDNIVLDGACYAVQGTKIGMSKGIDLSHRGNVTVKNMKIKAFSMGMWLFYSSNSSLLGNTMTDNGCGIWLAADNNSVTGSNITNNYYGIRLMGSNNTLRSNSMTGNTCGFGVEGYFVNDVDVSNTVNGKPVYYLINQRDLVINPFSYPSIGYLALVSSTNITIQGLELKNNYQGILLAYATNSRITNNNITNNEHSIYLIFSDHNSISGNNITENSYSGIRLEGISDHNSISGNYITNSGTGVWIMASNNSVTGNNITNNSRGIDLFGSDNNYNTISGNNITNNYYGVFLRRSSNNKLCHNNFIDNIQHAYVTVSGYANVWDNDYPSGGNCWSNYMGVDLLCGPNQDQPGSDGIGDTPYIIDVDNTDRYPLMRPWAKLTVRNINTDLYYEAINQAINAEQTLSGHTIFVESGTYFENVVVNKTLSLIGENEESTAIDGGGVGNVVTIVVDGVNITGFRIQNGGDGLFSAVLLNDADHCNITRNYVSNTVAHVNWGIRLYSSSYNSIIQNTITNMTCGIHIEGSSNFNSIGGNTITNHTGHGIYLYDSSHNIISGNRIAGNRWGFYPENSDSNDFLGNDVTCNSYGVWMRLSSDNRHYHNNFVGNTQQVGFESSGYGNIWDDDYPSGGNYWSDYSVDDLHRGPFQNETGSDGIGDTSYIIDADNRDNYPFMKPLPWGPHDIGITSLCVSKTVVGQDYLMNISTMMFNYGDSMESFNLTIYANCSNETVPIELVQLELTGRTPVAVNFTWNTTGIAYGNYSIGAYASPVENETQTGDNTLVDGGVFVTIPGDVNGDQKVNILDCILIANHFGHVNGDGHVPGSREWFDCANCDINGDSKTNVLDCIVLANHFGESWS